MASSPAVIGTPKFTLQQASEKAKAALGENYGSDPWESYGTKNEDVRSVYNKVFCVSADKVPIFITRASAVMPFSAEKVFNTVWDTNLELKWNVSTVSSIQVVQNNGNSQIVYQQHKTLAAASAKRDLLIDRQYEKHGDGTYWVVATSHLDDSLKPQAKEFVRSRIVFSGIQIKPAAADRCELTWIWCFDFCGWIHGKFIEQEFGNVALRISRIQKNVQTAPAPTPAPHQPQKIERPPPVNAPKGAGFCPKCGTARGDGKFCGSCGELLSSVINSVS